MDLKRKENESELAYIWRIGGLVDDGVVQTWQDAADILNKELRPDERPFNESAWRKKYRNWKNFHDEYICYMMDDDYVAKQAELTMLRQQFYDQRREYNNLLRKEARNRHLLDCITSAAREVASNTKRQYTYMSPTETKEDECILVLCDWHYGMKIHNSFNSFSKSICEKRVEDLIERVVRYVGLHKPHTMHILLLGDMAHGAIHTTARIASEEETCYQLIHVAELVAHLITSIAGHVPDVKVYTAYGNHMRTVQDKQESVYTDNMEVIIPWWLQSYFSNFENVEVIDAPEEGVIKFHCAGHYVVASHGDLDDPRSAGYFWSARDGIPVEYMVLGHKHSLKETEENGVEVISCRSLCGCDEYASKNRLWSPPGQTLMFFNEDDGRTCTYHIKL